MYFYNDVRLVNVSPACCWRLLFYTLKMTLRKFKKEIKNLITNIVFR